MSNAATIIAKLSSSYSCAVQECGGVVTLTFPPGPPKPNGTFIYQCDTCGAMWHQDGRPITSTEDQP